MVRRTLKATDEEFKQAIRERLRYDPTTGDMTRISTGMPIRSLCKGKYYYFSINLGKRGARKFLVHRAAWMLQTGEWPVADIDHKNHDGLDNRWENLREATRSENLAHRRAKPRDLPRGVYLKPGRKKKYAAYIGVEGQSIFLGYFYEPEEAEKAYQQAFSERYGKEWYPHAA